jgi:hypothetical protein
LFVSLHSLQNEDVHLFSAPLQTKSAKVARVASFPPHAFTVCHDGSILSTAINPKDLYYLSHSQLEEVTPQRLHTFDQLTMRIVELEPNPFHITASTMFADSPNTLWKLDMRSFSPSDVPKPVAVLHFLPESRLLNSATGFCHLAGFFGRILVQISSGVLMSRKMEGLPLFVSG